MSSESSPHELTPKEQEERYPAVKYAYDFVQPSYTLAVSRFEASVTRIQAAMTFAATLTTAAPVIGASLNKDINFRSLYFYTALGVFLVVMILGLIARNYGQLILTSPDVLREKALHMSEWEFKYYTTYYAGQHWEHNRRLVNEKARFEICMAVLIVTETIAVVLWLATSLPR